MFAGKILLTKKIGEGGMGSVFRGVLEDGTGVAVKMLHPELAEDPVYLARFEREGAVAAQIDHPNAVHVLARGVAEGIPYIVMELVEGRELFDVLARSGRLSGSRAAAIAVQVCDAVVSAHELGIIHRDLKPENVMLIGDPGCARGERVKLLDFGIARRFAPMEDEAGRVITVAGAIVGTPAYMSPEQCLGAAVDARSDVYACGALLYHLVTGRPPFEDENALHTLYRHVNEAPRAPSELEPDLDPGLEAIILKALQKRPEDRHQGAHELWDELLSAIPRLLAAESHSCVVLGLIPTPRRASLAPLPTPRVSRAPRTRRGSRRLATWLVGLAMVVGVGITFLGILSGEPAPQTRASSGSPGR